MQKSTSLEYEPSLELAVKLFNPSEYLSQILGWSVFSAAGRGGRRGAVAHLGEPDHRPCPRKTMVPPTIRWIRWGGDVTKFAPHNAPKLIARGKLTFGDRVVLHRVVACPDGCPDCSRGEK